MPDGAEVATIRCRSEVTQLHAANLVAYIADAATRAPWSSSTCTAWHASTLPVWRTWCGGTELP